MTENLPEIKGSDLIENNRKPQWNRKQLKAILILGDPSFDKTNKELASIIGVGEATIYRWKRLPEFNETISRLLKERVKDALPKVWSALVRYAKEGDPRHIKLFFELIGEYREKGMQVNIQSAETKILIIRPSGEKVEMK